MRILLLFLMYSFVSTSYAQSIHRVACQGNLEKLDSMLQTVDINIKNKIGSSLLQAAVFCRQEKVFDYLLEKGIDVNAKNKYDESALFYAFHMNSIKMASILIERGAEVDIINDLGETTLFKAVQSNNLELIELVLSRGVDINKGTSPLHSAVLNDNLDVLKLLINDDTNVDPLNENGNTPLSIAIRQKSAGIVQYLKEKGGDVKKVQQFDLRGEYVGQSEPALLPEVFAKNFISTENFTHTPAFSPDGKEIYFTEESRRYHGGTIMVSMLKEGKWTTPEPASIEGVYREIDPFISLDGSKMYFSSNRPVEDGDTISENIDLWMVEKEAGSWGIPKHLGAEVNTPDADWFPTISAKGTLFFSTGPSRTSNIVYSELKNGKYQKANILGDSINSEHRDFDPYIASDESYVIFSSNRPGGFGAIDLYISFKNDDGSWSKAKNMGETINSKASEFASRLSVDGKYLFFNRKGDIFWVSSKIIDDLKLEKS